MSICACARSRSFCELKGCLSHPEHGYYSKDDLDEATEPWTPRYYARAVDDDAMVLVDDRLKRIVSPPGSPETVVRHLFDMNRTCQGGVTIVQQWGEDTR